MEKKKVIKRVVLIAVICILVVGIAFLTYTQILFPLLYNFQESKLYIYTEDNYAQSMESEYKNAQQGLLSDVQLLSNKEYDFSNPEDFAHIVLWYEVSNRSVFDIDNIEFSVDDITVYTDRFMYKSDAVVTQSADRLDSNTVRFDVYMYIKDMSDEEIIEAVKGLKISMTYRSSVNQSGRISVDIPNDLTFAEKVVG